MSPSEALSHILETIQSAHIVCVGDVIMDFFVHGNVSRISPEAPVPILLETRRTESIGGAGNVVRNLSSMGAKCAFIGVIGHDKEGDLVEQHATKLKGVEIKLIRSPLRPTTKKIRYLSQGGAHVLRVDREYTTEISEQTIDTIIAMVKQSLTPASALLISDYGKGLFTPRLLKELIQHALSIGAFIAVDPKGADYSKYAGASLLTPNLKELAQATDEPVGSDEEIVHAARKIIKQCGIGTVLVTRSQEGMTLVPSSGEVTHIPTQAIEIYDVSGAGDTVISALTAAYKTGVSLLEAARFANAAAGIVVGKIGTAAVTLDELRATLAENAFHEFQIASLEEAVDQVVLWHRQGYKIGFTNGCFDLLHPGHIKILREARSNCDRLVVGLNSDASVKRLKGEKRPLQNQDARAEILSSLEFVNMVVIFDEDTPENLIKALKPDILLKGADYTLDKVIGADFVLSYGGEVKLIELVPNNSTTNIIQKM